MKRITEEEIADNFESLLNKHGYNFQYSIVRRAEQLKKENRSSWQLEGMEIPVIAGGDITHVDFVLFQIPRFEERKKRVFLVAECKRVDPAKGYWCFTKNPYTWRNSNRLRNSVQFDQIRRFSDVPQFNSSTTISWTERDILDLGLEINTGAKGDGIGGREAAINRSVAQVLRATAGFIQYLTHDETHLELDKDTVFIPAIFTTAKLFSSSIDLAVADLETGHLPTSSVAVEEKEWLWFNYNRSSNLSHQLPFDTESNKNYDLYFRHFTRTIAIVGPKGVDKFFNVDFGDWLGSFD